MPYSLEKLLPGIPEEASEAFAEKLRERLRASITMLVSAVRALEKRFGPEAPQVARSGYLEWKAKDSLRRRQEGAGGADCSLHGFCRRLEQACVGTHEWRRVTDTVEAIGYRFTRCLWAEIFRSLDAADIGRWICDSDEIVLKSFNDRLELRLTQRLMDGDPCCDHLYTNRPEAEGAQ